MFRIILIAFAGGFIGAALKDIAVYAFDCIVKEKTARYTRLYNPNSIPKP